MKIGIDVDGTLYPWTTAANELVVERFGVTDPGPHLHWDHLKSLLTPEQFAWIWTRDAAPLLFGRGDLIYPSCERVVNDLCENHEVHFVTHRNPEKSGDITARWLASHFHGYKGVHVLDNSVSKTDVLDFDAFIDDKIETAEEFLRDTIVDMLMPTHYWNANYEHAELHRFDLWNEVPAILESL